jgi:hypothetical protein
MNELFRAVSERLKAIFTTHAALELEAELILCHARRKAALVQEAARLEQEGLADLAADLRRHAGGMDLARPAQEPPALACPERPNGSPTAKTESDNNASRKKGR